MIFPFHYLIFILFLGLTLATSETQFQMNKIQSQKSFHVLKQTAIPRNITNFLKLEPNMKEQFILWKDQIGNLVVNNDGLISFSSGHIQPQFYHNSLNMLLMNSEYYNDEEIIFSHPRSEKNNLLESNSIPSCKHAFVLFSTPECPHYLETRQVFLHLSRLVKVWRLSSLETNDPFLDICFVETLDVQRFRFHPPLDLKRNPTLRLYSKPSESEKLFQEGLHFFHTILTPLGIEWNSTQAMPAPHGIPYKDYFGPRAVAPILRFLELGTRPFITPIETESYLNVLLLRSRPSLLLVLDTSHSELSNITQNLQALTQISSIAQTFVYNPLYAISSDLSQLLYNLSIIPKNTHFPALISIQPYGESIVFPLPILRPESFPIDISSFQTSLMDFSSNDFLNWLFDPLQFDVDILSDFVDTLSVEHFPHPLNINRYNMKLLLKDFTSIQKNAEFLFVVDFDLENPLDEFSTTQAPCRTLNGILQTAPCTKQGQLLAKMANLQLEFPEFMFVFMNSSSYPYLTSLFSGEISKDNEYLGSRNGQEPRYTLFKHLHLNPVSSGNVDISNIDQIVSDLLKIKDTLHTPLISSRDASESSTGFHSLVTTISAPQFEEILSKTNSSLILYLSPRFCPTSWSLQHVFSKVVDSLGSKEIKEALCSKFLNEKQSLCGSLLYSIDTDWNDHPLFDNFDKFPVILSGYQLMSHEMTVKNNAISYSLRDSNKSWEFNVFQGPFTGDIHAFDSLVLFFYETLIR